MLEGSKVLSDLATPAHPPRTSSGAPHLEEWISIHSVLQPATWEVPLAQPSLAPWWDPALSLVGLMSYSR